MQSMTVSSAAPRVIRAGLSKYPSRLPLSMVHPSTPLVHPRQSPVVWSTRSPTYMTPEQQEHYEQYGYVILRQVVPPNTVTNLKDSVHEFQRKQEADISISEENPIVTEPNSNQIRSIFAWHKMKTVSPAFFNLARYEPILGIAEDIVGSEAYVHQSRINVQPAFTGTGFQWHQDVESWMMEDGMPEMRACSAVVMLDTNDSVNGALMVIPGSHKHFVSCIGETPERNWAKSLKYQQKVGVPDPEIISKMANKFGIEYCEGTPGDVLLFDNNLLHGSHSNISPFSRTNCFIVYNSVENQLRSLQNPRPNHIAEREEVHTRGLEKIDEI